MKIKSKAIVTLIALCYSILFLSCSKEDAMTPTNNNPPAGGGTAVQMPGTSFSPGTLTIAAGQTVTWTNSDSMAHTVTSNDGLFDSGNMASGATYSHTFNDKGTFKYHCAYHAGMTGSIVVQ